MILNCLAVGGLPPIQAKLFDLFIRGKNILRTQSEPNLVSQFVNYM